MFTAALVAKRLSVFACLQLWRQGRGGAKSCRGVDRFSLPPFEHTWYVCTSFSPPFSTTECHRTLSEYIWWSERGALLVSDIIQSSTIRLWCLIGWNLFTTTISWRSDRDHLVSASFSLVPACLTGVMSCSANAPWTQGETLARGNNIADIVFFPSPIIFDQDINIKKMIKVCM